MARLKDSPADKAADSVAGTAQDTAQDTVPAAEVLQETAPETPVAKPATKTAQTLLIGAVLGFGMAALGYGAAVQFPLASAPTASAVDTAPYDELAAQIAAIDTAALDTAALEARITALESVQQPDPLAQQLAARIAALEAEIANLPASGDLLAELADIRAKVAQSDPMPLIKAAIETQMGAVQNTAETMVAEVAKAAQEAGRMSAMTLLQAALDTGAPYASAAGQIELPPILADHADAGIPSLTALRDAFPDAARAGLTAALQSDMGQTWGERATNFLRNQTGARSLTAREGNDPDAILSRVDAALTVGNLQAVMAEIAALPPQALAAMQPWIAQAKLRSDALAAYANLTSEGK